MPQPDLSRAERYFLKDRIMFTSTRGAGPLILSLMLAACPMTQAQAQAQTAPPGPAVTALMNKALEDYPGKEVLMLTVDFPPGAVDPLHRHDAHGFIYVLEGAIVMGVKGGKEQTLGPGQTFYEGPHDVHTVGRNASKTRPARFVVFLLKDKGKPAVIPVQRP
jgi:quercetin dioxygenase-like cupin family protein